MVVVMLSIVRPSTYFTDSCLLIRLTILLALVAYSITITAIDKLIDYVDSVMCIMR
ncbi:hypothetical protein BS17DRAFT_775405 [Gyrodon lividus]|nr:hypothetical protein BS17DRAFT_775405 [Gyrodon lividus]